MIVQPSALRFSTTATGQGIVRAIAAGDLLLSTPSNASLSASNCVALWAGGCNIMNLYRTHVDIRGGINVTGAFGTLATDTLTANDLYIANSTIRVSSIVGSTQPNESAIDGSGLSVSEVDTEPTPLQERSIRWRASRGGTSAMLKPGALSNASYWDVRGGGVRLTSACRGLSAPGVAAGTAGEVSYLLHINEREELEVVKRWTDAASGSEMYMRVAAFGRTVPSGRASGLL